MTDLSQMLRWNTGFVRGLAETVLNRAKVIRSSLTPYNVTVAAKPTAKKTKVTKTAVKAKRRPAKTAARKGKKAPITKQ